jgi:PPM family protein phosphatase
VRTPLFSIADLMDQSPAIWAHCLQYAAKSDIGLRRGNNQDSMAVALAGGQQALQERGHLFMVADGMGAHAAGELASKIAADTIPLAYNKLPDRAPPEALLAAITDANNQIHSRGQAAAEFKGMGTTCTVLVLLPQGALVAQVGDSRTYRLRGTTLEQLTFDHSLIWELRRGGQIAEDAIPAYVTKNIITRSLGPNPEVRIDLEGPFPLEVGDTFLLCSDGLSGQVSDEEIGTVLQSLSPDEAVESLVDLANLRGGPDNITVIVARVTGPQMIQGDAAPLRTMASSSSARPVHSALWTSLGVLVLATAGLAALDYFWAALACLIAAAATAIAALVQRYGGTAAAPDLSGRMLGRAPYVTCDCTPNAAIIGRLAEMVDQLREAAANENWTIDWNRFKGMLGQATAARAGADYRLASQHYLHALSFLLAELKRQRRDADDASADVL